jgi:pimeloyl-ACP methyl ester carboxylesterase
MRGSATGLRTSPPAAAAPAKPRKANRQGGSGGGSTSLLSVRALCKHLGCGRYSWTGWAVVCIFLLFSAITVRLLVIRRARQQLNAGSNTDNSDRLVQTSTPPPREMSEDDRYKRFQVGEGHTLNVLTSGNVSSDYLFLLVHGASREFQNSGHWKTHMDLFAGLGRVYAVDMLGHGHSTPGESDPLQNPVAAETQVRALQQLIVEEKADNQKLVLVGRSYGGRIVVDLADKLGADEVHKIILIAPALREVQVRSLKKEVLAVPTLVFWAGDDTTVPYGKVKDLLDYFVAKEVVLFDQVVTEGREPWEAHTPELIKVEEFQSKVLAWLS